ncbi:hypothetical protein [Streptomyces olivochromogenes]|uniref:hypothetical protein n=1 Tax=Streptomyces olivochromogenes TaxID=1963 RepID=UPI001F2D338D|nr:hypothetical protein [Streptomyces olivochromogenes]MCF3134074.1 hypothetical protein [Streptomyces olivochromogenes]
MPVPPARLLAASALTVAALVTVSGCLGSVPDRVARHVPGSPAAEQAPQASPGAKPALTQAQARAALITEADLGVPWGPTEGIATWRDGLLKAVTNVPECQRLLDALYADELLGEPSGTSAVTSLDDGDDQAQLRYRVAAHRRADAERTLTWLRTLPGACAQFTAATTVAGLQSVQVSETQLPQVGDDRQGLRVTLTGQANEDEQPTILTMDVAVVLAGDDAIVLTDGALGELPADATRQALEVGTQRLAQIRERGRALA